MHLLVPTVIENGEFGPHTKVITGETLELDCSASGNPNPFVSWFLDGEPLLSVVNAPKFTLLIPNIRPHQQGEYVCKAYNGIGEPQQRSYTVEVLGEDENFRILFKVKNHLN